MRLFMNASAISLALRESPMKDVAFGTDVVAGRCTEGADADGGICTAAGFGRILSCVVPTSAGFFAASRLTVVRLTLTPASRSASRIASKL